jgi:hypothetical protein
LQLRLPFTLILIAYLSISTLSTKAETFTFFDAKTALGAVPSASNSAWQLQGLPGKPKPLGQFDVVEQDTPNGPGHVLRVSADKSYGALVHTINAGAQPKSLSWMWRVAKFADGADLRNKAGDDNALKVCVLFDMPIERVPFLERTLLRFARANARVELPAATLCYVWDNQLPKDTLLANAFTKRLRYLVLQSGADGQWHREKRDIAADFARAFGTESKELPPIAAIAVGADADNTQSTSLGFVADLTLADVKLP